MNIVIRKKSMFSQNIYTITNNDPGIKFLMSSSPSKNLRELQNLPSVFFLEFPETLLVHRLRLQHQNHHNPRYSATHKYFQ